MSPSPFQILNPESKVPKSRNKKPHHADLKYSVKLPSGYVHKMYKNTVELFLD
jgi:hypothetical protein